MYLVLKRTIEYPCIDVVMNLYSFKFKLDWHNLMAFALFIYHNMQVSYRAFLIMGKNNLINVLTLKGNIFTIYLV